MIRERRTRIAAVLAASAGALVVAAPAAGAAGPSGHASCVGIELAAISPPGSLEEFPGGAPDLTAFVKAVAAELGVSPGTIVSFVASLHEGSHEACDEATE